MPNREYIGARYVPLIMGEYDAGTAYEPLSVVLWQGNSYTSLQSVPEGVTPQDSQYWVLSGNYSAEAARLDKRIDNIIAPSPEPTIAELVDVRLGADGVLYDGAGVAVRANDKRLQEQIDKKVDKLGNNQVRMTNLEGVTVKDGTDLTPTRVHYSIGGKYAIGGVITDYESSDYRCTAIPVKPSTRYRFSTNVRWWYTTDASGSVSSSGEAAASNDVTTSETSHLLWYSYNYAQYGDIKVAISETMDIPETEYVVSNSTPFALPDSVERLKDYVITKPFYSSTNQTVASGGTVTITDEYCAIKKGYALMFSADVSNADNMQLHVGFMRGTTAYNRVVITNATVAVYKTDADQSPVVTNHGLTVSNNITVIIEQPYNGSMSLTLISNGDMFTHEYEWCPVRTAFPFAKQWNMSLSNCVLKISYNDVRKRIWMFGDSYLGYAPDRWPKYLHDFGFDKNTLLDGYGGESSNLSLADRNTLMKYGKPEFIVWCLGMNDGSDSASTPSAAWKTEVDRLISMCNEKGITPIFATIPTVPTVNNEQKNAWIRGSGYRYIDFAKAVGAGSSGAWYAGMLSSDGVHPSESGAKALFARVLIDLPEIMGIN